MNKRVRCVPDDRLSNLLPGDVIQQMLACLPLKDAVKTSLLSKQWKNRWISIPSLVFDCTFSGLSQSDLFKTIYHVLLLHLDHPITSFALSVPSLKSCVEINHLMFFLSKFEVQEFTLVIDSKRGARHKLSSSMFSLKHLSYLELSSCVLCIPSSPVKPFVNLKSIVLENIDFNGFSFEKFLDLCPFVESWTVRNCLNFQSLVVGGPKLEKFYFLGDFEEIFFTMSPVLTKLEIVNIWHYDGGKLVADVVESFANLPRVEHLFLDCLCLTAFFRFGDIPASLPTKLDSLKVLRIWELCFESMYESALLFCLIKSSPALQELEVKACIDGNGAEAVAEFLEAEDFSGIFLELRVLRLLQFRGLNPEIVFIKRVLSKSPQLELLHIQPFKRDDISEEDLESDDIGKENKDLSDIFGFFRASPRVLVKFEGSFNNFVEWQ